jgi:hypothetical protein
VLGACWVGIFGDGTLRRDEVQGKGIGRVKEREEYKEDKKYQ